MHRIERLFPGALASLLSSRVSFGDATNLFDIQRAGIKTVFEIRPS